MIGEISWSDLLKNMAQKDKSLKVAYPTKRANRLCDQK